jgi:hypothetical protein
MEGFKSQKKVACFKEGGQVGYKSRNNHSEEKEMAADIKQDKAIVKKAVSQHESAKHKGEGKTELKLKNGGRAKKEKGTVRKYATGGGVTPEQSAAYKDRVAGDMATAKKIVAGELPAQSTPGTLTSAERRASIAKAFGPKLKTGGKVGKYCGGGMTKKADGGIINKLKDNIMGTEAQNEAARKRLDKVAKEPSVSGAVERAIREGVRTGPYKSGSYDEMAKTMPDVGGAISDQDAIKMAKPMPYRPGKGPVSDFEQKAIGRKKGGKC